MFRPLEPRDRRAAFRDGRTAQGRSGGVVNGVDPFSDKPLVYEPRDAGYRLASVGVNGVHDDGGADVEVVIRPPSTSP